MLKKAYALLGLLAPLFYLAAVLVGGELYDGYSHTYNTISELTSVDAPELPVVEALFALYNISVLLFGLSALFDADASVNYLLKRCFSLIIPIGAVGLAMYFFPQDHRELDISSSGQVHIVLAAAASLLTMLSIFYGGRGMSQYPPLKPFSIYSYLTLAGIIITGALTARAIPNLDPWGGVYERMTIGLYLVWVFVIAMRLLFLDTKSEKIIRR